MDSFIVKVVEERLDVEYNHPRHRQLEEKLNKLKSHGFEVVDLATVVREKIKRGKSPKIYSIEGLPVLKVRNLLNERIDWSCDYTISSFVRKFSECKLQRQDVLLASTGVGSLGKADIFNESFDCIADGHISIIRTNDKIEPEYLLYFLRSLLGQTQIERLTTGSTGQIELSPENLNHAKILLPLDKSIQRKIIFSVKEFESLAEKYRKEYEQTLSELTKIISKTLGFSEPDVKQIYTTNNLDERLDFYFNSPEYQQLLYELHKIENNPEWKLLNGKDLSISDPFSKEELDKIKTKIFKYVDIGNTDKKLGEITGFEEDILLNLPTRARQVMSENDVLIPRPIGSTEGIVLVPEDFQDSLCSTGFIKITSDNKDEALFLWALMKSNFMQRQFFLLQSGSLQPEITPKNFKSKVLIPMPRNKEIKEKLVHKIAEVKNSARISKEQYTYNKRKVQEIFTELFNKQNKNS